MRQAFVRCILTGLAVLGLGSGAAWGQLPPPAITAPADGSRTLGQIVVQGTFGGINDFGLGQVDISVVDIAPVNQAPVCNVRAVAQSVSTGPAYRFTCPAITPGPGLHRYVAIAQVLRRGVSPPSAEIQVTVPVPPTPANDTSTTFSGQTVLVNVVGNDTPGTDPIDAASLRILNVATNTLVSSLTLAGQGTFTVQSGQIAFSALAAFAGTASVPYRVCDVVTPADTAASIGPQCGNATLAVVVGTTPTLLDDSATTTVDTAIEIPVLANDSAGLLPASVSIATAPARGSAVPDASTGRIVYAPQSGFAGTDTFVYRACTAAAPPIPAVCGTASVSVRVVQPAADLAVAVGHQGTIQVGGQVTLFYVVSNSGPQSTRGTVRLDSSLPDSLALVSAGGSGWSCSSGPPRVFGCTRTEPIVVNASSVVVVTADVKQDVTPVAAGGACVGAVSARVSIGGGTSTTIDANPLNNETLYTFSIAAEPPVATDDTGQGSFRQAVVTTVLANDRSPICSTGFAGGTVELYADAIAASSGQILAIPGRGVFTVQADGAVRFVPEPGFFGALEIFYTVRDGLNQVSNRARLRVVVRAPFAYITNFVGNDVTLVDVLGDAPANQPVVRGSVRVGRGPDGVVISSVGGKVYVANNIDNSISVIDAATNAVESFAVPAGEGPVGLAIDDFTSPRRLYSANHRSNDVTVIDLETRRGETIRVGARPAGIVLSPDRRRLYVANSDDDTVSVIDTASRLVVATVPVGQHPAGMAVSADGARLYVANGIDNTLSVIDTSRNAVEGAPIALLGLSPGGLALARDGRKVYVTNFYSDNVSVVDLATRAVSLIAAGRGPTGASVDADGRRLLVTSFIDDTVWLIDLIDPAKVVKLPAGSGPSAFGKFVFE